MAYINQENKKELMPEIKNVFKKYGFKGSVKIIDYAKLVVTLKSGPFDFKGLDTLSTHIRHIEDKYTAKAASFLKELVAAMKGPCWKDDSDMMSDYFSITYYLAINLGSDSQKYQINQ